MSWLFEPGRPWRPVDAALADAVRRRWPSIPVELLRLFAASSFLIGQGHSALDPSTIGTLADLGLPDWPVERWHAMLAECPAVSSGDAATPFVLDRGLLYLRRFHRDEVRLAARLAVLSRWAPVPVGPMAVADAIGRLFPESDDPVDDRQARACLVSLASRLTVVLGGPGTGKTTTVLRLLALHQLLSAAPLRIAVAAPTGKAAARVAEAMQSAADRAELAPSLRALMPARALTLHRLLGAYADGVHFRHGRDDPLACDLVVLDEASMVDLGLFARLVEALPDHARLIVLGDPDQLEAIESGAVLAELARLADGASERQAIARARACIGVAPPEGMPTVGACVVRLTRAWRFAGDSGIGELGGAVRSGDAEAACSTLCRGYGDLEHVQANSAMATAAIQDFVRERYQAALATGQPAVMLAAHRKFRILAATRMETGRANASSAAALGQRGREMAPESGLPFLIERNDALRRLYNGDTGVFSAGAADEGLRAWFTSDELDVPGALRAMAPYEIGQWLPAYAMTVHRAQGSEYDEVMVLLPSRITSSTSRSWLYTAISRARRKLVVVGTLTQLAAVMAQATSRASGLANRLRDPDVGHR